MCVCACAWVGGWVGRCVCVHVCVCMCMCVCVCDMALSVLLEEHAEFDTVARKGDPALLQALAARMSWSLSLSLLC